jgi:hypothetical protein
MALRDGTILTGRNKYLDRIYNPAVNDAPVGGGIAPIGGVDDQSSASASPAGLITPAPAPLNIFPWWLYETPGAQDWDLVENNFTVAVNAVTVVPNFTFQVNTNNVGVIKQMFMTVQNPVATISLSVTLLLNGSPISGWTKFFPPASATTLIVPFNDMIVRLPENGKLTAQFRDVGGATPWQCSLNCSGWQVSKPEVLRLQGAVNY